MSSFPKFSFQTLTWKEEEKVDIKIWTKKKKELKYTKERKQDSKANNITKVWN